MGNDRALLSAAIITKNEEEMLPDCLRSISFADEIVVVDSGSSDKTVEIAKAFGCRVFVEEWKGYGPQKQSAIDKCRHEWVLSIDADERIPPETKESILRVLADPGPDAYSLPRKNFLSGRWISHSDWWPDRVIRLVNRKKGFFKGITHEKWASEGTVDETSLGPIEHYGFSGYSDMLRKLDDYSTAIAKELYEGGKRAGAFSPVFHGAGMFLRVYFMKLGFLDGFDGLVIALLKAGGSFFKYAKLRELAKDR